jgi:hypothetical protein
MGSGEGRHTEADGPRSIQRCIRQLLERTNLSYLEYEEIADPVQLLEPLHSPEREHHVGVWREGILVPRASSASSLAHRRRCMRTARVTVLHIPDARTARSVQPKWKSNASVATTRSGMSGFLDGPQRHLAARRHRRHQRNEMILEVTKCTAARCAERRQGLDDCADDDKRTTGASASQRVEPNFD